MSPQHEQQQHASSSLPVRVGYDRWSNVYDDDANPLIVLEEPHVDRILANVDAARIADIGCGTGRHAIRLARRGAYVTAVDFSAGMLAAAQSKPGADLVRFIKHDITATLPLDDNTFDHVLCCLVLDHIHNLESLFAELRRICRPDGDILITVMHPAMSLLGVTARFHDPDTNTKTAIDSVTNEICDYINAAQTAGLNISHINEHRCDQTVLNHTPRAERYLNWPMLLTIQLTT